MKEADENNQACTLPYGDGTLKSDHINQHDAAEKSFNELTRVLDKLAKFDKEHFVIDYFGIVEAHILLEKDASLQKLLAYYNKLVDSVHERKARCLHNLKTNTRLENELAAIKRTFEESQSKREHLDCMLKALDGDEAKWKAIQDECNKLLQTVNSLGDRLEDSIVGDHMLEFIPCTSDTHIENSFGHLANVTIDSAILCSDQSKYDLVALCTLSRREFTLLYRASRDGFEASDFHARCDHKPSTLTLIKTADGYIFGGYTAAAWDSTGEHKADPAAFIFSLVNHNDSPQLIPLKVGNRYSIYCDGASGPSFGGGCDLYIANSSNTAATSYSNLGRSYDFTLFSYSSKKAQTFLANAKAFQTSEIEVFQLR